MLDSCVIISHWYLFFFGPSLAQGRIDTCLGTDSQLRGLRLCTRWRATAGMTQTRKSNFSLVLMAATIDQYDLIVRPAR